MQFWFVTVVILLNGMKGCGGKMKNREEWRLTVQEAKAHPEL
jgi:hypothetical protein